MRIGIIGGGIVGLALGYKLSDLKHKITVFEKDNIGSHQSGNNSGVLHCGLHYKPGSLKAALAVQGIRQMINFCEENKIEYDQCGKIVVSTNERENLLLDNLSKRGSLNGLKGLKILTERELKLREPHVYSKKTLLVPEEGIVNYKEVMRSFSKLIQEKGGEVLEKTKVVGLNQKSQEITLITDNSDFTFDLIINCAGLFSDKVFEACTKEKSPLKIVPFRGEYHTIKEKYSNIINHLVYPVPDPTFPFLGVHFTRMIDGSKEVGPNAVLAFKREGYKLTDINFSEFMESLTFRGLHRFIGKNLIFSMNEFLSSTTKSGFVKKARKLIPDIKPEMFDQKKAGVRAQALSPQGDLLMDFEVKRVSNQIHVLNAPSPGATASLSIADYIIENYL